MIPFVPTQGFTALARHRSYASPSALDANQPLAHPHDAAAFFDQPGDLFPYLSGTMRWIAKAIDQGLDDLSVVRPARQQTPHKRRERQSFDPLGGPLRTNLGARHAPDLFGVAAEKDLIEPPSKCAHDPVFEASTRRIPISLRLQIAQETRDRLARTEFSQRVDRLERIFEKATAIVDTRKPTPNAHPLTHQLRPQGLDLRVLGEEAMASDIESKAFVFDRPRQPADVSRILLQHDDRIAVPGQFIAAAEARRTCTHNYDTSSALGIQNRLTH